MISNKKGSRDTKPPRVEPAPAYIYNGGVRLPLGGVFSGKQFYFLVDIRKNLRIEIIMISKKVCYTGIRRW